jgi:hypothetical protein
MVVFDGAKLAASLQSINRFGWKRIRRGAKMTVVFTERTVEPFCFRWR